MAKGKQANNASNPGGRKRGMNKKVLDSRKALRTWGELEYRVSDDVLEAYNVIRGILKDEKAPPATRRSAANDVIAFFEKIKENSEKVVEEFEEEYEGNSGNSTENQDSNVRPMFNFSE
tara:strand:- start:32472 stop:32828 length:357 start_codon:yes stop_codon:yes gene_type:complete